MIRATYKSPLTGKLTLLLGVDRENINRLTAGKPILVIGEPLGLECDVAIAFGETLDDVRAELEKGGLRFPPMAAPNDR